MTDCTMDNNPYAYSEIKQLSGNIPQNINSLWNLSQMLGSIDNLLTSAYFQAMQDAPKSWQEYALLYAKNDTAITLQWNDDHSACVALVGASETVQEQFQAALQTLMEEIPDVYHRLSANALTIFAQVTDSQAAESLAYGDGLFLFQCTKKQEKKLGKNGIYDLIYCALANAAGKQVFLDANSVILQNEGTGVTGKALAIDLATGVNTLQLSASVLPEQAQQTVTWLSSNDAVATVSDTGLVTAIKPGKVTISATTTDGTKKKATCKIKVIDTTK